MTPEDFSEAGRVIAAYNTVESLLSPGTTTGVGAEVGGGDGETGSTVPLSPSTPGTFGNVSSLPLLAGTYSPPVFFSDEAYTTTAKTNVSALVPFTKDMSGGVLLVALNVDT